MICRLVIAVIECAAKLSKCLTASIVSLDVTRQFLNIRVVLGQHRVDLLGQVRRIVHLARQYDLLNPP